MRPGKVLAKFTVPDGREVTLRSLAETDLPALLKFANAMVKEKKTNVGLGVTSFDSRITAEEESKFLGGVLSGLRKNEVVSVAAFVDGQVVGNCHVSRRGPADIRHTGTLGIAILEGYRGIGVGSAMVRTALEEAAKIGVWLVELTAFADNHAALHLYEKSGFRKVGIVPAKIQRRGRLMDEISMYADLRGTDKSTGRRPSKR